MYFVQGWIDSSMHLWGALLLYHRDHSHIYIYWLISYDTVTTLYIDRYRYRYRYRFSLCTIFIYISSLQLSKARLSKGALESLDAILQSRERDQNRNRLAGGTNPEKTLCNFTSIVEYIILFHYIYIYIYEHIFHFTCVVVLIDCVHFIELTRRLSLSKASLSLL